MRRFARGIRGAWRQAEPRPGRRRKSGARHRVERCGPVIAAPDGEPSFKFQCPELATAGAATFFGDLIWVCSHRAWLPSRRRPPASGCWLRRPRDLGRGAAEDPTDWLPRRAAAA